MYEILLAKPWNWLSYLAQGWSLACLDDPLPVADFVEWNTDWPVVLLRREVAG